MTEDLLRISGIVEESIVDGPGIRFTIFTQGCFHFCPECHNPQTHSLTGGSLVDIKDLFQKIKNNPLIKGVTFSGGEPFLQAGVLARLANMVHGLGKDVITYSGYTYEEINSSSKEDWHELLRETDYLIDGPFLVNEKSLLLKFRGSKNQRIIDVKATQKSNKSVITIEF